jgi:hypothetical protein
MMASAQLKTELHHLIDKVNDSSVLKAIQTLLKKQLQNSAVGYDAKGKKISTKAFIRRIEKAETEVKAGKFVTIDELEKESEKW